MTDQVVLQINMLGTKTDGKMEDLGAQIAAVQQKADVRMHSTVLSL